MMKGNNIDVGIKCTAQENNCPVDNIPEVIDIASGISIHLTNLRQDSSVQSFVELREMRFPGNGALVLFTLCKDYRSK